MEESHSLLKRQLSEGMLAEKKETVNNHQVDSFEQNLSHTKDFYELYPLFKKLRIEEHGDNQTPLDSPFHSSWNTPIDGEESNEKRSFQPDRETYLASQGMSTNLASSYLANQSIETNFASSYLDNKGIVTNLSPVNLGMQSNGANLTSAYLTNQSMGTNLTPAYMANQSMGTNLTPACVAYQNMGINLHSSPFLTQKVAESRITSPNGYPLAEQEANYSHHKHFLGENHDEMDLDYQSFPIKRPRDAVHAMIRNRSPVLESEKKRMDDNPPSKELCSAIVVYQEPNAVLHASPKNFLPENFLEHLSMKSSAKNLSESMEALQEPYFPPSIWKKSSKSEMHSLRIHLSSSSAHSVSSGSIMETPKSTLQASSSSPKDATEDSRTAVEGSIWDEPMELDENRTQMGLMNSSGLPEPKKKEASHAISGSSVVDFMLKDYFHSY